MKFRRIKVKCFWGGIKTGYKVVNEEKIIIATILPAEAVRYTIIRNSYSFGENKIIKEFKFFLILPDIIAKKWRCLGFQNIRNIKNFIKNHYKEYKWINLPKFDDAPYIGHLEI